MIDYCLFMVLFQNDILSYSVIGEPFVFKPKIKALIDFHKIPVVQNAELVIINNESHQFIDYYWKNILTSDTKWLFVVPKDEKDARNIFNEIRGFGEPYFVQFPKPLVIIKNVRSDFKDHFRENILAPINTNETKGYFCHSDYAEKAWLYQLTDFQSLHNFYKFDDFKINIPVY